MTTLRFHALITPALLTALALPAGAQDIDPYALYEASKAAQSQTAPGAVQSGPATQPIPTMVAPEPKIKISLAPQPEPEPEAEIAPKTEPQPEPAQEQDSLIREAAAAEYPKDNATDENAPEPAEESEAVKESDPESEAEPKAEASGPALPSMNNPAANAAYKPVLNRGDIAPFFLSAAEYLALRQDGPGPQMNLIYSVTQSGLTEGSKPKTFDVALAVGPDYVARQSTQPAAPLKIYDFKYNRVLSVTGAERAGAPLIWVNVPLYALAHRNTRTVSAALKDAKDGAVQISPAASLNTFWVESAYSLGLSDRDNLVLDSGSAGGTLKFDGERVFEVSLSGETYETPEQSDAMLAFAHLDLPVHPAGLKQLYAAGPVKAMTIISKSPGAPQGQKQVWTLKTASAQTAEFPLPAKALNALSETQNDPITFVMNQAARGIAPGGPPKYDELADAVLTAYEAEDFETAWLAAKRYELFSRPCKKNNIRKACKTLRAIEDMRKKPQRLEALIKAYAGSEDSKDRVTALQALRPWLDADDTPADILRLAGVLRAKIDSATAKVAGVDDIEAGRLIRSALLKDPYNPQMYLAMAQFYAAGGDYNAAWNSFDTLRSSVEPNEKAKFAVDRVERGLQDRAPGYFIPAVMSPR